jgi:hypothetical protein
MPITISDKDIGELRKLLDKLVDEPKDLPPSAIDLADKINDLLPPPLDPADIKSAAVPSASGPNLDPKSAQGRRNLLRQRRTRR